MTSCNLSQQTLVLNIVGEHFGDIVRAVAQALLRVEKSTLADIIRRVKKDIDEGPRQKGPGAQPTVSSKQVRNALLVLTQHNCLATVMPTEAELELSKPAVRLYYRYAMLFL
jgi:transposase